MNMTYLSVQAHMDMSDLILRSIPVKDGGWVDVARLVDAEPGRVLPAQAVPGVHRVIEYIYVDITIMYLADCVTITRTHSVIVP